MTDKALTIKEAYDAMFAFLEAYYERGKSDEIGGILGSMSLLDDGKPANAAYWSDWLKAVNKSLGGNVASSFKLLDDNEE